VVGLVSLFEKPMSTEKSVFIGFCFLKDALCPYTFVICIYRIDDSK
jgi:hypothetical protein